MMMMMRNEKQFELVQQWWCCYREIFAFSGENLEEGVSISKGS